MLQLCETRKALVKLQLFGPTCDAASVRQQLANKRASALISHLRGIDPLPDTTLVAELTSMDAERREVNEHLPASRACWDKAPHYSRGSESLAVPLAKMLRKRGWVGMLGDDTGMPTMAG